MKAKNPTRNPKHKLADDLTNLTGRDLQVTFHESDTFPGLPSEERKSKGHVWQVEHFDPADPEELVHLFWVDDRKGDVREQIASKLRRRAAWLVGFAKAFEQTPKVKRKAKLS